MATIKLPPGHPALGADAPRREPPDHLTDAAKAWWRAIEAEYDLDPARLELLNQAAAALDRIDLARGAIAKDGAFFTSTTTGEPRAHPALRVEAQARVLLARLLRELQLDGGPPELDTRPARLRRKN